MHGAGCARHAAVPERRACTLDLLPRVCRGEADKANALQILKQDWPSKWPSFITDIVNASKTSELLCENSMVILKLLSEEIFDFSRGELTTVSGQPHLQGFSVPFTPSGVLSHWRLESDQAL